MRERKDRRTRAGEGRWVDGENLNEYAGVLLGFHAWCVDREITFRLALIRAVKQFMAREEKGTGGNGEGEK